ncbi:hypothetical protein ACLOJK_028427 [Asimina triloba]
MSGLCPHPTQRTAIRGLHHQQKKEEEDRKKIYDCNYPSCWKREVGLVLFFLHSETSLSLSWFFGALSSIREPIFHVKFCLLSLLSPNPVDLFRPSSSSIVYGKDIVSTAGDLVFFFSTMAPKKPQCEERSPPHNAVDVKLLHDAGAQPLKDWVLSNLPDSSGESLNSPVTRVKFHALMEMIKSLQQQMVHSQPDIASVPSAASAGVPSPMTATALTLDMALIAQHPQATSQPYPSSTLRASGLNNPLALNLSVQSIPDGFSIPEMAIFGPTSDSMGHMVAWKVPCLLNEVYMCAVIQGIRNYELTRELGLRPPRSIYELNEVIIRYIFTEKIEEWWVEQDRLLVDGIQLAKATPVLIQYNGIRPTKATLVLIQHSGIQPAKVTPVLIQHNGIRLTKATLMLIQHSGIQPTKDPTDQGDPCANSTQRDPADQGDPCADSTRRDPADQGDPFAKATPGDPATKRSLRTQPSNCPRIALKPRATFIADCAPHYTGDKET